MKPILLSIDELESAIKEVLVEDPKESFGVAFHIYSDGDTSISSDINFKDFYKSIPRGSLFSFFLEQEKSLDSEEQEDDLLSYYKEEIRKEADNQDYTLIWV